MRDKIEDAIAENLTCVYICSRVWEAWSVNTMTQNDFHEAAYDEDFIGDMTDSIEKLFLYVWVYNGMTESGDVVGPYVWYREPTEEEIRETLVSDWGEEEVDMISGGIEKVEVET